MKNSHRNSVKVGLVCLALLISASVFGADNRSDQILASVSSSLEAPALSIGAFSGGGNSGSSSSYRLSSTVTQVAIGSGGYNGGQAYHGLWYVINGLAVIPCCGLYTGGYTGNTNCDPEGRRDMIDITTLIDFVYISHRELCCAANANIANQNGEMINLSDITRLIDHIYISHAETAVCQ